LAKTSSKFSSKREKIFTSEKRGGRLLHGKKRNEKAPKVKNPWGLILRKEEGISDGRKKQGGGTNGEPERGKGFFGNPGPRAEYRKRGGSPERGEGNISSRGENAPKAGWTRGNLGSALRGTPHDPNEWKGLQGACNR